MLHRDYTFLGTTHSLCPECWELVPAKIVVRRNRVYFRKRCPTHGEREDFVCSDVSQYDQMQYSLPGRMPSQFGVEAQRGCPWDCGLCDQHEQHTCVGLVEITSGCNLTCPMCYASSAPGGQHLTFEDCQRAIDRLVEVETRPEVLQISGGEPTIHPQFEEVLDYACRQPIDIVMINTNGLRLARDPALVEHVAQRRQRIEVYLQFDGFSDATSLALRGESLVETKLRAIETLGQQGIRTILVTTLQAGVNDHEIGAIVKFALDRPWITGVSFQPATYSGRHVLPEKLERRITFPDVIQAIAEQTDGLFQESDFMPLPCAHPNCHSLTYAYRVAGRVVPLMRLIDARNHLDLLANGITFTRPRARQLIETYLASQAGQTCCGGQCGGDANGEADAVAQEFFGRAIGQQLAPEDMFRITITSFLDAYNFDLRRLMKCCIHHVLPSGHVVPFCAYNVLYRNGKAPLPTLRKTTETRGHGEEISPRKNAK